MTWPVNWIEQAQYYQNLTDQLAQLQAQGSTVTVHSFSEPLQQDWEDAYTAQTGLIPAIAPGTRLIWMDLKNGQPKHYETVWSSDNVTIDSVVRPYVARTQARSCLRFLGTRQMMAASVFNPVNAPIRHRAFSLTFDIGMLVRKNLIAIIIHHRLFSPVMINVFGETAASADYGYAWGDPTTNRSLGGALLERAAGVGGSTLQTTFSATVPFAPIASYVNSVAIVTTEQNFGYTMIFGPAGAIISGTQQPMYNDMAFLGFTAALTAQATPLRLWQGFYTKYMDNYSANLKNLLVGTPTNHGESNEHAYVYGLFASDPGSLQVFDV